MNSLGKRVFMPLSLAFGAVIASGCASPPPPPPVIAPPPPERTCETLDKTDVMGDARMDAQVTRTTTTTRCVTQ
jgi:PBP1b-binding outer membrane lipoprotein LpoB